MKLIFLLFTVSLFIACEAKDDAPQRISPTEVSIVVDFSPIINIPRSNNNDMIRNVPEIIFYPESRSIANLNEIEPNQNVANVFQSPFENLEFNIISQGDTANVVFNGIHKLLHIFDAYLSVEIIEKINNISSYTQIIRMDIENLNIYVYRLDATYFALFMVEYENNFPYEPIIRIGDTKNEIISLLGIPTAYSNERNIFIYESSRMLGQVTIFFEGEKVNFVQFISWGGI